MRFYVIDRKCRASQQNLLAHTCAHILPDLSPVLARFTEQTMREPYMVRRDPFSYSDLSRSER
jgi:hypothetical protein